jgi:hypothetical protein
MLLDSLFSVRLDQLMRFATWRRRINLGKEAVASYQLPLGRVVEVGKTLLHDGRLVGGGRAIIVSDYVSNRNGSGK